MESINVHYSASTERCGELFLSEYRTEIVRIDCCIFTLCDRGKALVMLISSQPEASGHANHHSHSSPPAPAIQPPKALLYQEFAYELFRAKIAILVAPKKKSVPT